MMAPAAAGCKCWLGSASARNSRYDERRPRTSRMKHATWQMTRIGPAKTGTYHWAAMCVIAPVAAACGNATRRSREPTTVQAQAKPRAADQPFRSPMNATAARNAVRESPAAVEAANSVGIPGDRLAASRCWAPHALHAHARHGDLRRAVSHRAPLSRRNSAISTCLPYSAQPSGVPP
jgi:hypothetical protein